MPKNQPSLRDLCNAERVTPTLKRWAIVGRSLRDKDILDLPLVQEGSFACTSAAALGESAGYDDWPMRAEIVNLNAIGDDGGILC
jgi:hypothetical protein